ADSVRLTIGLFRRHVAWRAQKFPRARNAFCLLQQPGHAKVGKMRLITSIQQDVSRLDVSMENAPLMRVVHCARQSCDKPRRPPRVSPASRPGVKRFALD